MYSGTILRNSSGHLAGTHQRIDRIARRHIAALNKSLWFPSIRSILHFEGNNGPDGIKRKSPGGHDEPWHFVNPDNPDDNELYAQINHHHHNLVIALKQKDEIRAGFEAAWLSHAIVDGMTPAHHYPLADKIKELWGKPKNHRDSVFEKNIIKGNNVRDSFDRNWQYWGAKGVFTTHFLFEFGVATSIAGHRFYHTAPSLEDVVSLQKYGLEKVIRSAITDVYHLNLYQEFWTNGWTARLAAETRRTLVPLIIRVVTLAWYDASMKAGK